MRSEIYDWVIFIHHTAGAKLHQYFLVGSNCVQGNGGDLLALPPRDTTPLHSLEEKTWTEVLGWP